MPLTFTLFFGPLLLAFVVAWLATPLVIRLYSSKNWLDDPRQTLHQKITHTRPVPRGGGWPIFLGLVVAGLFTLELDKHSLGILAGAFILTVVGSLDDLFDLNPYLRLATGLLAAAFVTGAGIGIAYITNPLGATGEVVDLSRLQLHLDFLGETHSIWILSNLFALVWITWLMNIVNWSKGVDGQMPGFVAIAAIFVGLLSLRFSADITQWQVVKLAAITAGAYLGFLFWNKQPQKIMPGYGGGSLAGFLLAVLSILSGAKVATLILVLGLPVMDAAFTITRRLSQGKSPVWGDRGHLHHRLLDLGWSKQKIASFYWVTTFFLGLLALQLNSTQKLFTIIMIGAIFLGFLLFLKQLKHPHGSTNH